MTASATLVERPIAGPNAPEAVPGTGITIRLVHEQPTISTIASTFDSPIDVCRSSVDAGRAFPSTIIGWSMFELMDQATLRVVEGGTPMGSGTEACSKARSR